MFGAWRFWKSRAEYTKEARWENRKRKTGIEEQTGSFCKRVQRVLKPERHGWLGRGLGFRVFAQILRKKLLIRRAWRNRDPNWHFHSPHPYSFLLDFTISTYVKVCPFEIHPLIWFFFKGSFTKKKNIRLDSFVNRSETWDTASTHPCAKYVVTDVLISL